MLVFGGSSFGPTGASTYPTDIGVYDPANNTWQVLNPAGGPTAVGFRSAIWTGTKMIVWGGETDGSHGGIYDPATNTWKLMSNVGAPSKRGNFAMVWTGTKVIIWGGSSASGDVNGDDFKNDGAIYDPVTDTWQAMSLVNAPVSRYQPGHVWSGTKMIIWGGYRFANGQVYLNDGASFDPATNTWQAISTSGAPSARARPAAQWSGSKMIVWGGVGANSTYPNLGGIYDPATNTWQAMSTNGAPATGSYWLTSVWTGTKMLIWSFRPNTSYDAVSTNDGAIFY
jgi:N-acetylneuraminic acid mutarotase